MDFIGGPGERHYGNLRRGRSRGHRHQSSEVAGTSAGLRRDQKWRGGDEGEKLRSPWSEFREVVDAGRHHLHRSRAEDQRGQVRQEGAARTVQGFSIGDGIKSKSPRITLMARIELTLLVIFIRMICVIRGLGKDCYERIDLSR